MSRRSPLPSKVFPLAKQEGPPAKSGGLFSANDAVLDLVHYSSIDQVRFGTGWSIDDLCGEPGLGELALIWARSGSGKSTMVLNMIRNTPEVPTLVVNMEMTPRRQIEWLTTMTQDISVPARFLEDVLRAGEDDRRYHEVLDALTATGAFYKNVTFYQPESRPSVKDLAYQASDLASQAGKEAPVRVFIDHMGLMAGCTDYHGYVRTASELHSWAMNEGICVFALQQTGRGGDQFVRNDGHLPVTLSSGVYAGEADADWIFGMFRPDRDPKFMKSREQIGTEAWFRNQEELSQCKGITYLQVIKNRPFGDTLESGIQLMFDRHTRRLEELGEFQR